MYTLVTYLPSGTTVNPLIILLPLGTNLKNVGEECKFPDNLSAIGYKLV